MSASIKLVNLERTDEPIMSVSEVCAMLVFFQGLTLILGRRIRFRVKSYFFNRELLHVHNPHFINAAMRNTHA